MTAPGDDYARQIGPRPGARLPRPTNDTWVAACCLAYDLPLATRNVKDVGDFAEHEGLTILGR